MNLFLYNFNDYYNRIVKKYDKLEDYGAWLHIQSNYNFKEGDGVRTEVVVNSPTQLADYLIAADESNEIVSRWFIVNSIKNREGQYNLILYRDLVADFYSVVVKSPTFIEKATLNLNNSLIFNSENMTYNQIKQQEIPLKDKFGAPWIVGYIDRQTAETPITIPGRDYVVDYSLSSIEEYDYYTYTQNNFRMGDPISIKLGLNCYSEDNLNDFKENYTVGFDTDGRLVNPGNREYWQNGIGRDQNVDEEEGYRITGLFKSVLSVRADVQKYAPLLNWKTIDYRPYIPSPKVNLWGENGKIIKAGNDYYKVRVVAGDTVHLPQEVNLDSALGKLFARLVLEMPYLSELKGQNPYTLCITEFQNYTLALDPIMVDIIELTIPGESNRVHCRNVPYDVFAIPYAEWRFLYATGNPANPEEVIRAQSTMDAETGMRIAQQIQIALGSQLYDLQLLPYCPIAPEAVEGQRSLDLEYFRGDDQDKYITYAQDNNALVVGAMMWVADCNFRQSIIDVEVKAPQTNIECKVMNETKIYRLCSPNYSGIFEINAAKNKGLKNFVAYCSYKPISPYIQIAPSFDGLYGGNFEDSRGLICGGDFSLPRTADAWIEYELNNKNYQIMFDRQIENLSINNNIARFEQKWAGITGTLQAGGTGAAVGMGAGGAIGAGIGATVGTIASAFGAAADYDILLQKQKETLDFTKDQFGYTLGNIAAQPTSLTKVSAFNINNKIFPFLEIYGATAEEEQALINKLKYNGMTVMTIGKIEDYLFEEPTYIKGKIIRFESLEEDYHISVAISEEINKGVYI